MPFACPECASQKALRITHSLELPPDSRSDEITLQIVQCTRCQFAGVAVYEESRRGRLNDESVDHYGYYVRSSDLKDLKAAIKQCPDAHNPRCDCAVHITLGRADRSGRWRGLGDIEILARFEMKLK